MLYAAIFPLTAWGASSANATPLSFELRYTGGPAGSDAGMSDPQHVRRAMVGTYPVELWARVRGTDGNHTNEALHNVLGSIASTQFNGGAASSGSISNLLNQLGFNEAASRVGGPNNDITPDGMGDWGGTSSDHTDQNYMMARNATPMGGLSAGGSVGNAVDADAWEYRLSTFILNVTGLSGNLNATTRYDMAKPIATKHNISTASYSSFRIDGVSDSIIALDYGSTYVDSIGIRLVPEPTGLAPLLAAGCGLLGRRRR